MYSYTTDSAGRFSVVESFCGQFKTAEAAQKFCDEKNAAISEQIRQSSAREIERAEKNPKCPKCGDVMIERKDRFGRFDSWQCPSDCWQNGESGSIGSAFAGSNPQSL